MLDRIHRMDMIVIKINIEIIGQASCLTNSEFALNVIEIL
jgi:hypothetical protein